MNVSALQWPKRLHRSLACLCILSRVRRTNSGCEWIFPPQGVCLTLRRSLCTFRSFREFGCLNTGFSKVKWETPAYTGSVDYRAESSAFSRYYDNGWVEEGKSCMYMRYRRGVWNEFCLRGEWGRQGVVYFDCDGSFCEVGAHKFGYVDEDTNFFLD